MLYAEQWHPLLYIYMLRNSAVFQIKERRLQARVKSLEAVISSCPYKFPPFAFVKVLYGSIEEEIDVAPY